MPKRLTIKPPTRMLVKSKASHYGRLLHDFGNMLAKSGSGADFGEPDSFAPPDIQPITIPKQFATFEQRAVFTTSAHEVCHGLMNLLQCNDLVCLTVQWINGFAIGSAMNLKDQSGHPGACIAMAGLAGEQLVEGVGSDCSGSATDIRMAKQCLRDADFDERDILPELVVIFQECQRIFIKDWLPGIKAAAIKLASTGMLSPSQFVDAVSTAQSNAHVNGVLNKAINRMIHEQFGQGPTASTGGTYNQIRSK